MLVLTHFQQFLLWEYMVDFKVMICVSFSSGVCVVSKGLSLDIYQFEMLLWSERTNFKQFHLGRM